MIESRDVTAAVDPNLNYALYVLIYYPYDHLTVTVVFVLTDPPCVCRSIFMHITSGHSFKLDLTPRALEPLAA
jgi:hypothetical protein